MFDQPTVSQSELDAVFRQASKQHFYPRATVRCADGPVFRSQLARDLACLLDVDDEVVAWSPLCFGAIVDGRLHVSDFMVDYLDGRRMFLDAIEFIGDPAVTEALACMNRRHRFVPRSEMEAGHRLQNAKDLLRYARCRTPLNDRVRLLAALEEAGSLRISETFGLFRESQPLTAISYLILHRFITADLDHAPLGPATRISRFQS